MKKYAIAGAITIGCIILASALIYIYLQNKETISTVTPLVSNQTPLPLSSFYNSSSTVVSLPLSPSFPLVSPIALSQDIRLDLQYEEPEYSRNVADYLQSTGTYTDPSTGEQYLLLAKKVNQSGYGDREYSIFQAKESHSYQGTPIYLSSVHNNQSLSYIGLKLNDPALVSSMRVELGVDYLARSRDEQLGFVGNIFGKLISWLSAKIAEACGPGIYLRNVGDSSMTYAGTKDGISWFKLDQEISVSDIPLSYCNRGDCGGYEQIIKDLSKGNLRMHIDYIPAGNKGVLKVQLADAVFHNSQDGSYSAASLGKGSGDIYRAILSDQEYGSLAFAAEANPTILNLVLENKGTDPIVVDDYSFNRIRNSQSGKQALGFVVRDSQNIPVAHISFDTILGKTKGKTIQPGTSLSIEVLPANSFRAGLYTISVEYLSSISPAPIAPRAIYWDFEAFSGDSIFTSKGRPLFAFVLDQYGPSLFNLLDSSRDYTDPSVTQLSYSSYLESHYSLRYLKPSASNHSDFADKTGWNGQRRLRPISINDLKNNTGPLWGGLIPSMTSSEFLALLGIQPTNTLNDFEGNQIQVYHRNQMTGYVVERSIRNNQGSNSIHGILVYEIPTDYLTDNLLAQIYLFTIKSVAQVNAQ